MSVSNKAVSVLDAAHQLGVSRGRVWHYLGHVCPQLDVDAPNNHELLSPEGAVDKAHPEDSRTIDQASITAFMARHDKSPAGRWVEPLRDKPRRKVPPSNNYRAVAAELKVAVDELTEKLRQTNSSSRSLEREKARLEYELKLREIDLAETGERIGALEVANKAFGNSLTQLLVPDDPSDVGGADR